MSGGGEGEFGKYPAYIGVLITLCVIAVLLNLLVIFLVIKFGKYRASTDIFMTNLAISDIIHAAIVTPIHLKTITSDHEDFYGDNAVCKIIMFIPLLTTMSAIFTMVVIAIDRYRSIVQKKQIYRRGAIIAIVIIWIASVLFSSPLIYEYNIYADTEENYTACGSEGIVEHFETVYATFAFCCGYFIPLIIIAACYTQVVVCVWKHGKRLRNTRMRTQVDENSFPNNVPNTTNRLTNMMSARIIKILKMLISLTVSFVLLWTPYFILFGITEITGLDDSTKFNEWPHVASRLMTVLSTISNPVLYLGFCEKFRQILRESFTRTRDLNQIVNNKVAPSTAKPTNSMKCSPNTISKRTPIQYPDSGQL